MKGCSCLKPGLLFFISCAYQDYYLSEKSLLFRTDDLLPVSFLPLPSLPVVALYTKCSSFLPSFK